jgi:hypothetical protein
MILRNKKKTILLSLQPILYNLKYFALLQQENYFKTLMSIQTTNEHQMTAFLHSYSQHYHAFSGCLLL